MSNPTTLVTALNDAKLDAHSRNLMAVMSKLIRTAQDAARDDVARRLSRQAEVLIPAGFPYTADHVLSTRRLFAELAAELSATLELGGTSYYKCILCSTRATAVMVPTGERQAHEADEHEVPA
jgi:hypothetical protein